MLTFLERMAITPAHRREWYLAMGKTAENGLPQIQVLELMVRDQMKVKHPMVPLLSEVLRRLKGGSRPGAPALRTVGTELSGLVPSTEQTMVQAGIDSGRIPEGFNNAAVYLDSQGRIRGVVLASMAKPILYIIGMIALLFFFSFKILPAFQKSRPRANWPSEAQMLGTVADHIWWISGGVIGTMILISMVMAWVAPNWTGEKRDWADRHVFPFTLMASITGSGFLTSLSAYLGAGVSFNEAINNMQRGGTPYMASQCQRIVTLSKAGKRFDECLVKLPIIHPRFHWLISVYGLSADSAVAFRMISEQMTAGVEAFVKTLFDRVIGNLFLVAIGAMVLWIYTSMFGIADASSARTAIAPGSIEWVAGVQFMVSFT